MSTYIDVLSKLAKRGIEVLNKLLGAKVLRNVSDVELAFGLVVALSSVVGLVRLVRVQDLGGAHLGSGFHHGGRVFCEVACEVALFALADDTSLVAR